MIAGLGGGALGIRFLKGVGEFAVRLVGPFESRLTVRRSA